MAKIFIGSSTEARQRGLVSEIAEWLEAVGTPGHTIVRWDDPGVFMPGRFVYESLLDVARSVDAAVLVFAEDDQLWYREDQITQPRANVLIEYGLFSGVLGRERAIICKDGDPRTPTDLSGVTYVDVRAERKASARRQLEAWAKTLAEKSADVRESSDAFIRQLLLRYAEHVEWWTHARPIQPNLSGESYLESFGAAPVWAYMRPPRELIHFNPESTAYEVLSEIDRRLLNFREDSLPVAIWLNDKSEPIGIVTPTDLKKLDKWFHDRSAPASQVCFGPPHQLAACHSNETCRDAYGKMLKREPPILTGLPVVDSRGSLVGFLPHHGGREDWEWIDNRS
jgi:hypothetical protein